MLHTKVSCTFYLQTEDSGLVFIYREDMVRHHFDARISIPCWAAVTAKSFSIFAFTFPVRSLLYLGIQTMLKRYYALNNGSYL